MAGTVLGLTVETRGEPTDIGVLVETGLRLQELDAWEQATELVLPAATRGEQLFQGQRAIANLLAIPPQRTEVVQ